MADKLEFWDRTDMELEDLIAMAESGERGADTSLRKMVSASARADYDNQEAAVAALAKFDPEKEKEPNGWMRHPESGRRRPEGDALKEYVMR